MPRPMNVNEFMFLSSQRVPNPSSPPPARGDVRAARERPLLHPRGGAPQPTDRLAEQLGEAFGLLGGVVVWPGADPDGGGPAAFEADERAVGPDDAAARPAVVH